MLAVLPTHDMAAGGPYYFREGFLRKTCPRPCGSDAVFDGVAWYRLSEVYARHGTYDMSRDVPCQVPRHLLFPALCGTLRPVTSQDDPRSIRSQLIAARKAAGRMSQKELAEKVGVDERTVKRWEASDERKGHIPDEERVQLLLDVLPLDPSEFTQAVERRRPANRAPVGELEAILDRLLSLRPDQVDLLRGEAAELAGAIRRLSEKADLVADRLDALAAPGNGHQADGTSG